jgi:hypothetical protein
MNCANFRLRPSTKPAHAATHGFVDWEEHSIDPLVSRFSAASSQFASSAPTEAEDSARTLIDLINSDSSGHLHTWMTANGIASTLISVCQLRLPCVPSISHIQLLHLLLTLFPHFQTDKMAYFVFHFFSEVNGPTIDRKFLQFLLTTAALLIKNTTVDHITPTFTRALKSIMCDSLELHHCVAVIFARSAPFIPLDVKHRHFAILARHVISSCCTGSEAPVAEGFVAILKKNPHAIDDSWVVDMIVRILHHDESVSTCILFDFFQTLDSDGFKILEDQRIIAVVQYVATREGGVVSCYCSAFRVVRRYLEINSRKCAELYCDCRQWGMIWSVMSLILTLPFAAKIDAGLLITSVLRSEGTSAGFLRDLDSTTVYRDRARRIENALLVMLTLENYDLLVDALKTLTFIFDSVYEPSALWNELVEVGIIEAIEAIHDQRDDQIEALVHALNKRAKPFQE